MYWLLGIDTVLRITAALLFLFVLVPWLAWRRPASFARLEWFWWCLGVGLIALTLIGQLLTLFNIASSATYVLLIVATIIVFRARRASLTPLALIRRGYHATVLFSLNVLERRISVRRRVMRAMRRARKRLDAALTPMHVRWVAGAWIAIVTAAAATRLYRPFATANLGFSDTYVHLYLMRLLDAGRQVDPAWGPYPRGMHFLLLAIERLTNVDAVLLMNFFGAFSGILITLAVADAARRATSSMTAALVAGLAFATMIGGASQYYMLGGSVATDNPAVARDVLGRSYAELAEAGEYDVLLTVFQRQCSTLPQELATVLLFPAALFLFDWLRRAEDRGYRLAGFIACTAAIAATHSGVVIPLVFLCGVCVVAGAPASGRPFRRHPAGGRLEGGGPAGWKPALHQILRAALFGALGVLLGSTWMLGYIRYRASSTAPHTESTARYYFPFLRRLGDAPPDITYTMVTPFLIAMLVVAIALLVLAIAPHPALRATLSPQAGRGATHPGGGPSPRLRGEGGRRPDEGARFIAMVFIAFFLIHASGALHLPELVEARRNAVWLAMAIAALLGVAASTLARVAKPIPAFALLAWLVTVPLLYAQPLRAKIVDYSGYGSTAYAVVKISRAFEPYSWTLVSYGQEFPMVLGRGFHLPAAEFLQQFDPAEGELRVPTRYVFIAVEKRPHRFQIDNWAVRFDRTALEERLQTWCSLYALTHHDIRIYLDDENVRVYMIERREG